MCPSPLLAFLPFFSAFSQFIEAINNAAWHIWNIPSFLSSSLLICLNSLKAYSVTCSALATNIIFHDKHSSKFVKEHMAYIY